LIRVAARRRQADDWALALASAGIASRVEPLARDWVVVVAAEDRARAADVLAAYDRETAAPPPPPPPAREYGPTPAGVVAAALLVAVYAATGPRTAASPAFRAGTADAAAILDGELWRTVTALTLHADASHLAGNALAGAALFTLVCHAVGPGVGLWLVLLSGAGGNALNAWLRGPPHRAVGASTAVLGAVGVLAGLAAARGRWRRAWVPVGAGLALLALLGTAEESDLGAHLMGFVAGVPVGALAGVGRRDLPGPMPQRLLALAALAAVGGCWALALGRQLRG
jgi:membrane associated rhomboid family serine protease